jgi:hypothetical protein
MSRYYSPIILFFSRCYNVCRWLPTIWKDRDWDDSFIVDILVKKLEHQRDFFLSDNTHLVNSEETANQIQKAIDGLIKTKDSWEYYEGPAYQEVVEKWGENQFRTEPFEDSTDMLEVHLDNPNIKTEEDKGQYYKEFKESMVSIRKQYVKDKRAVYKYIADNIDNWWD